MSYSEKMELVKKELIVYCNDCINNHNNGWFDMWLSMEGRFEVCHGYERIFKKHFEHYIDDDLSTIIWHYGDHLTYGIQAFKKTVKEECTQEDIFKFIESFITNQLDNFDNSYDCLVMSFPDPSDETETQNNEDNIV